jgi:hypothetical protein
VEDEQEYDFRDLLEDEPVEEHSVSATVETVTETKHPKKCRYHLVERNNGMLHGSTMDKMVDWSSSRLRTKQKNTSTTYYITGTASKSFTVATIAIDIKNTK